MKKYFFILTALAALLLAGCGKYPDTADDGTVWDENWEMMGRVLGVEEPGNGLVLLENNSILTGDDTYYATWAVGGPADYVNADGEETDLYEAQLYLLLYGCSDEEAAEAAMAEFIGMEEKNYDVSQRRTETHKGQAYEMLVYECVSDTNPFARGVSAFGIYENYVISAEFTCLGSYSGDVEQVLADFLEGCHYSSQLLK